MSASVVTSDVADILIISSAPVKLKETISAAKIPFESLSINDFLENIEVLCKYIMAQEREKIKRRKKQKNNFHLTHPGV